MNGISFVMTNKKNSPNGQSRRITFLFHES